MKNERPKELVKASKVPVEANAIIKWKLLIDNSVTYEKRSKDNELGGDILDALEEVDNFLSTQFASIPIARECEEKLRNNKTFVVEEAPYKVTAMVIK